jgi:3-oxoacyl-[acyl-carrier protein] reductase
MADWDDEFSGRKVVLTGACGVFGHWIAEAFAKAGARLCLSDMRGDALATMAGELDVAAKGGMTHVTNLADSGSIDDLVAAVGESLGRARHRDQQCGVYPSGFLIDIDAAEWDRIFDTNLRAPFLVSRGFARLMIAGKTKGNIVNISSGAARRMRRTVVPYCTSKTALDRLTKGFAIELAEFGIRVNAVEPGFAPGSTASPLTAAHVESTTAGIPLGRASLPDDAPNAIMFVCSSKAAYITGSTISVDGGNSIGSLMVYQDKKNPG